MREPIGNLAVAASSGDPRVLATRKGAHRVSVCIPARNEEMTVGAIVSVAANLVDVGLVDEVVVVDDGSTDATASSASSAGATVVASRGGPGKGEAMRAALDATTGDVVVFVDADVSDFSHHWLPVLRPVAGSGRCSHQPSSEGRHHTR